MRDGGPAYPAHDYIVGDLQKDGFQKLGVTRGMSLRDWLAGMALQAIDWQAHVAAPAAANIAASAYKIADAMLEERDKA